MLCILWQWNGVLHKIDCITFTKHLYVYAMTGVMLDFSLGAACTTSPWLITATPTHHCKHSSNAGVLANRKWITDKRTWSEYKTSIQAV